MGLKLSTSGGGAVHLQPASSIATDVTLIIPTTGGTMATLDTGGFPSGTRMSFQQTASPTGWTKDTTAGLNDSVMRIVTGTASSGGSTAFSTWAAVTSAGATTLSTAQIPSHNHVAAAGAYSGNVGAQNTVFGVGQETTTRTIGNTGSGGSHTHSLSQSLKYYDFIIASKD